MSSRNNSARIAIVMGSKKRLGYHAIYRRNP